MAAVFTSISILLFCQFSFCLAILYHKTNHNLIEINSDLMSLKLSLFVSHSSVCTKNCIKLASTSGKKNVQKFNYVSNICDCYVANELREFRNTDQLKTSVFTYDCRPQFVFILFLKGYCSLYCWFQLL